MLQTAAVYPGTLDILKRIMESDAFRQFNLVGGTALALQIGHRISVDLDFFTNQDFDNAVIIQNLQSIGKVEIMADKPPFLQVMINDLKVDFLKFPYPFVQNHIVIEGVRLVSIEDIAPL